MNFEKLHEPFKDDDSPSVEGQIRWLQKQKFTQAQIEQALLLAYSDLNNERIPQRWKRTTRNESGTELIERHFLAFGAKPSGRKWESRDIQTGFELDQFLLNCAKRVKTTELGQTMKNLEAFKKKLELDYKNHILSKRPWYKRLLGIKSALKSELKEKEETENVQPDPEDNEKNE